MLGIVWPSFISKTMSPGTEEGIDPEANQVIAQLEGQGIAALRTFRYFFDLFCTG